jgi:hypothetical protein
MQLSIAICAAVVVATALVVTALLRRGRAAA